MNQLIYKPYSKNGMIQIAAVVGIALGIGVWQNQFITNFVMGPSSTEVGLFLNTGILALLGMGMARLLGLMGSYAKEEKAVQAFYKSFTQDAPSPLANVNADSLIAKRYETINNLSGQNTNINHEALAALTASEEESKLGLMRFLASTFILLGMLGTIVSLGIALLGASDLLVAMTNINDIGVIVNGMSTALSTTMSGILAFLIFRFSLMKLEQTQQNLLFSIERITVLNILPKVQPNSEALVPRMLSMIRSLDSLVQQMALNQKEMSQTSTLLHDNVAQYNETMEGMSKGFDDINQTLSKGFRL